jgi:hypothetical protein
MAGSGWSVWQSISKVPPGTRCDFCNNPIPQAASPKRRGSWKPIAFRNCADSRIECKGCRAEALRAEMARSGMVRAADLIP